LSAPRRGLASATIFAVIGVAILVALGVWQLERKVWKENLIATMTERLERAPQSLPPRESWRRLTQQADEFSRVRLQADFLPVRNALVYSAGSALRPDVKGPGYWVFAPARLPDGGIVVVDRGFLPLDRKDAAASPRAGITDIVGVMRWPEKPGMFTPATNNTDNVSYLRDIAAMAKALDWGSVAPFYVEQESPVPPGGLPNPGKLVVHLPDNHLQYAITWFGLALALIAVYGVFVTRRLRGRI
jgi:surfeit locus 1 family protein